jgi:hypothetical protein
MVGCAPLLADVSQANLHCYKVTALNICGTDRFFVSAVVGGKAVV